MTSANASRGPSKLPCEAATAPLHSGAGSPMHPRPRAPSSPSVRSPPSLRWPSRGDGEGRGSGGSRSPAVPRKAVVMEWPTSSARTGSMGESFGGRMAAPQARGWSSTWPGVCPPARIRPAQPISRISSSETTGRRAVLSPPGTAAGSQHVRDIRPDESGASTRTSWPVSTGCILNGQLVDRYRSVVQQGAEATPDRPTFIQRAIPRRATSSCSDPS